MPMPPEIAAQAAGTRSVEPVPSPVPGDANAFFRGLVDGMRCGILAVDRGGRLLMCNGVAAHILELSSPPRFGLPIDVALPGHPQICQILRESFEMSSLPNRAEIELRGCGSAGKTVGFTLSLVRGEGGSVMGSAIFFKDLTHVEHREEQERLRDRLAALGQMSANLAHEIRNPLAAIEVSCSLLKRRLPQSEPGRELLEKIVVEVRRLNRTITSSLEYVKPVTLALSPASIDPVLEEALLVAEGRRGRPGIRTERRFERGIPPFLMDRSRLRQVFENLFLNAMEAMGEHGVLTVETATLAAPESASIPYRPAGSKPEDPWQRCDRYVVVVVTDTGGGIAEEHQDKLFYPFFTTKTHGSGVGLPMARKIVDSHRGLIDFESRPGCGTVFRVRLPLVEPPRRIERA